jgi:hypothetical protein
MALRERLESLGVPLDGDGRAEHLRQVVLDTVDDASLGQALADLREGSGGELTATESHWPKFHSAFSSYALRGRPLWQLSGWPGHPRQPDSCFL